MKRNFFTAALESELQDTATVADVMQQANLQPNPGTGEEKGGECSLDDVKATVEFGEDALIAEHDDIDAIAESQEHTLALEYLQTTAMRFCRMGAALEEIAETAETNLEAGQPMNATTVAMLTTAVDAAGVGEPMADVVATESFEFSATIATEGFIDAVKERAEKVWSAVAKFFKKAIDLTVEGLKRFADHFRDLIKMYEKMEADSELLAGNAGKPFQSAKYEKDLHDRIWAPASTKTVIQAVDNAASEYAQVMNLADVKMAAEIRTLNNSWATDKPEQVVAAMNKVLALGKQLAGMGRSKFMHSSVSIEVNLPDRVTLDDTGGLEGVRIVWDDGAHNFSAGVRTASVADLKHLKSSAVEAERALKAMFAELINGDMFNVSFKSRAHFGAKEDDKLQARKLLTKYSNLLRVMADLVGGCIFGAADGYWENHFAASKWIRYSVAEAKTAARASK